MTVTLAGKGNQRNPTNLEDFSEREAALKVLGYLKDHAIPWTLPVPGEIFKQPEQAVGDDNSDYSYSDEDVEIGVKTPTKWTPVKCGIKQAARCKSSGDHPCNRCVLPKAEHVAGRSKLQYCDKHAAYPNLSINAACWAASDNVSRQDLDHQRTEANCMRPSPTEEGFMREYYPHQTLKNVDFENFPKYACKMLALLRDAEKHGYTLPVRKTRKTVGK